jgi:hypothetical protein
VPLAKLFGLRGGGRAGVADLFGVFAVVFVLGGGDGVVGGGGGGDGLLRGLLGLLRFVKALVVVGALDLLVLLHCLEALLVGGDIQRLEWVRHLYQIIN